MNPTKKSASVLFVVAQILFVFLFVFFMYAFIHETGHALAGWLFGQSLTEFDVSFWDLSAHVGLAGADLTQAQLALQSAAGTFLPLVVWITFISLVPRKSNFTVETLKLFSSLVVINTLLTWIFIPLLFWAGKAPSDDVTHFLIYSRMSPLLLSFISLGLYAAGWKLFLSRIDGLQNEFRIFSQPDASRIDIHTWTTIAVMAGLMAICTFLTLGFKYSASQNLANRFSPPPGFVKVAEIDLSARPYSSEVISQFTQDQPGYTGVFIAIRNIDTEYFDLSIAEAAGSASVVLHGEGYRADQDGGLWEKSLPPGTYRLVLTSAQSSGTASIYLKTFNR